MCIKNVFDSNLANVASSRERDMMNLCLKHGCAQLSLVHHPTPAGARERAEGVGSWHKFSTVVILKDVFR